MTDTLSTFKDIIEGGIGFVKRAGLEVVELAPRHVKLKVALEGNVNHVGMMYAGALFTLAEIPGGAIFLSTWGMEKFYPVIKAMNIRFRRPTTTDATITIDLTEEEVAKITREAEEKGKADFVLIGNILDAKGEVVAVSESTYQMRRLGT